MDQIRIAERVFSRHRMADEGYAEGQAALAAAWRTQQRPLCLCSSGGVPMYVGKTASQRYYLARMPGTGAQHSPTCPSFQILDDDGRGYGKDAIQENEDGSVAIKLSAPLSSTDLEPAAENPDLSAPKSSKARRGAVTQLGLLNYLWERAEFNRWYPKMMGKRSWSVVRKHLLLAAEMVRVNRHSLAERLYIPEPFEKEKIEERAKSRESFFQSICGSSTGRCRDFMVVLAPVSEIAQTKYGFGVTLKHIAGVRFWMDETVGRSFHKNFARELLLLGNTSGDDRLIGLFIVDRARGGNYIITNGALMRVTKHWIPVESRYESTIANSLVDQLRVFAKPMRYDAAHDEAFPDFHLLDCGARPVPMEIYGFSGNLRYEEKKKEKIRDYQQQNERFWQWEVSRSGSGLWPPFPPVFRVRDISLANDGLPLHGD